MSPLRWAVFKPALLQFASLDVQSLSKLHIPVDSLRPDARVVGTSLDGPINPEAAVARMSLATRATQRDLSAGPSTNNLTDTPYSMNPTLAASNG